MNPLIVFAKYGKAYTELASLRDLIKNELKLNKTATHGGEIASSGSGDENI